MKVLSVLVVYFTLAVLLPGISSGKGWRGIVPLESTRVDVERILGPPDRSGDNPVYRTEDGLVAVKYATAPCKGRILGWNVSAGTVLEFQIAPRKREKITIDLSRYVMAQGHVMRSHYINLDEGVGYELLPDGQVFTISYIPSKVDNRLRCAGFPPYDGGLTQYRPFNTFANIPIAHEEGILDNLAFHLQNDPYAKGYIIVYAGQRSRVNEAKTHAERLKDYLVSKRGIDSGRLKAVDGGYRKGLETDLFVVPGDLPAPTPTPTISSNEVQIIKAYKTRNNRRLSRRYNYEGGSQIRVQVSRRQAPGL